MQNIREARLTDLEKLISLVQQLNATVYTKQNVVNVLKDTNTFCYVLEQDDRIIGTVTLSILFSIEDGSIGFISGVIVDKYHRGRGNGKLLLRSIIEYAQKMRIRKLKLESQKWRVEARNLYQSLGFKDFSGISMEKYLQ